MEALHYREHRCLAVQGFIAAVRYVAWPAARGASGGQPEQVGEEQPNSVQREMGFRRSAVDHDVMLFFMVLPYQQCSTLRTCSHFIGFLLGRQESFRMYIFIPCLLHSAW